MHADYRQLNRLLLLAFIAALVTRELFHVARWLATALGERLRHGVGLLGRLSPAILTLRADAFGAHLALQVAA